MSIRFFVAAALALGTNAAHAAIVVTAEAPGVQNSTAGFSFIGVETFNGRATGTGQTFNTNFGGSSFSGTYTNVQIDPANQFGGAGGTTEHAVTFSGTGYTLDVTTALAGGVNYFGFWLSALDGQNQLKFFKGGSQVFSFSASDALTFINAQPNASDYYCNPNTGRTTQNCGEPYAFLNFYGTNGTTFDRIQFFQDPVSGGYESDNHSVGQWDRISGDPLGGIPEPSSWAMLIAGFGLVGAAARRRRQVIA
jgi:hypothetical protein